MEPETKPITPPPPAWPPKPTTSQDGVLVLVDYGDDGNITVDVQTVGSVRVTEVDTLLKTALKTFQARLGLN